MSITVSGGFKNLEKFLKKDRKLSLDTLGRKLVSALQSATPSRSGKTAMSWSYRINGNDLEIINTNINKGVNIAVIIHYGHGTGTGGYVPPKPYITDAIDSVYKTEIQKVLKEYVE